MQRASFLAKQESWNLAVKEAAEALESCKDDEERQKTLTFNYLPQSILDDIAKESNTPKGKILIVTAPLSGQGTP